MIPGEIFYKNEDLILNEDFEAIEIEVTNTGDRAVQIGSHFHFFEVNRFLKFDRSMAFGKKLDITNGVAHDIKKDEAMKNLVQKGYANINSDGEE